MGDARPQVGHPRLELHPLKDPFGKAVDQPPDPTPQGANATLDLYDIRIRPIRRHLREASPILVSDPLRIVQDRFDLGPHGASRRSLRTGRLGHTAWPSNGWPSLPMQR